MAIKACNELRIPLVIVGEGIEMNKLKNISGSTIQFKSNLTDEELVEYYRNCRALIFPGLEDFGLSILEAQFFGKPVIAYKGGGALETIIDKKTGKFFFPQSVSALKSVLKDFNEAEFKSEDCRKNAEKFNTRNFEKQFIKTIKSFYPNINL